MMWDWLISAQGRGDVREDEDPVAKTYKEIIEELSFFAMLNRDHQIRLIGCVSPIPSGIDKSSEGAYNNLSRNQYNEPSVLVDECRDLPASRIYRRPSETYKSPQ